MTRAMRSRSRFALAVMLGIAGVTIAAAPVDAQPAAALGQPLPASDLPTGTVTVRIVAGAVSSPVVGTQVTLVVNNTPRAARTDDQGRATFAGLPVGAGVIAKVVDEDKVEHASEGFTIPSDGGIKVMITTKPWQAAAAGAAPFAGGAGMPNPRRLSGEPRGEQGDPSGTITVRVTYDDFKDTPEGVPVALVGYVADGTITHQLINTDKSGRAQFVGLDRSGGTAYYALALLPRNGGVDRLTSSPVLLDTQVGMRMVLSGEKRDSKAPPVDDLGKRYTQAAIPAGKVQITLDGAGDASATVSLVDAATRQPLAQGKPTLAPADPSRVQQVSQFVADPATPAGTLDVEVFGGPGQGEAPLAGIEIRVAPVASRDAVSGSVSITGADGTVRMVVPAAPQKATFTVNGRSFSAKPFDLRKSGGKLQIRAQWPETGQFQTVLDVATTGQTVYAECAFRSQQYRSLPFQLRDGAGTSASVYVYPRAVLRFQLQADVEDEQFAVRGRIDVMNNSWAPYRVTDPDGLIIAMPRGFTGAGIAESDQSEVALTAGKGFHVLRPVPPIGRSFHVGFFLPISAGKVVWDMDLPLGLYQGELDIKQTGAMALHTEGKLHSETQPTPQGPYYVLGPMTIMPKQSMHLSLDGLPSQAAWRAWVRNIVGIVVAVILFGGLMYALLGVELSHKHRRLLVFTLGLAGPVLLLLRRDKPADGAAAAAVSSNEARRQQLLDQLVDLERTGGSPKRREQLLDELEQLWGT